MEEEKRKYLSIMNQILDLEEMAAKKALFLDTYITYSKYCHRNNLPKYNSDLYNKSENLFIIDGDPIDYSIDNNQKMGAISRLKGVQYNIAHGISDGISLEDAKAIIESTVQNARVDFFHYDANFFQQPFTGMCGYSQALTAFPLLELGVNVTINNVSSFPDCSSRHAFITCMLPIKEGNKIYEKQFLIDATYR